MKSLHIIIFFIVMTFSLHGYNEMEYIREQFYLAVEDEDALERLEEHLIVNFSEDITGYPPIILAYKGGIEALKAKHAFSPFSKFSHLMDALDILETAVSRMPGNLEISFIRFSILDNIPSFFGYGKERNTDKKVIISELLRNDFSSINKETQKGIIEFLLRSDNLSESEKSLISEKCVAFI
jgi:hypothetical protein